MPDMQQLLDNNSIDTIRKLSSAFRARSISGGFSRSVPLVRPTVPVLDACNHAR